MKIEKITPQIAALYLGQKCYVTGKYAAILSAYYGDCETVTIIPNFLQELENGRCEVVLHLRRLESMTEEEAREVYEVKTGRKWVLEEKCLEQYFNIEDAWLETELYQCVGSPSIWLYLLSKGFDLFNLIDAGLAKEITIQTT